MASNLVVNFIGNNKLSKTTAVLQRDLKSLGKTANSVGASMSKALGAVGLGVSLAGITKLMRDSAKAAVEDSKSKNQLALALQNTLGSTKATISETEKWISRTALATAVVDDKLRPALATAVRATGDLAKGQSLLRLALDVSAGTGKDVAVVTGALSKAFNGNQTALKKLVPGIKLTSNFMKELSTQFAGAAENAANSDPFARLQVIFGELKETIGYAILPYLQDMAKYLASTEGQREINKIVQGFVSLAKIIGQTIGWLLQNINLVKFLVLAYAEMKLTIMAITFAMKAYDIAVKIATMSTKALKYALISSGIGAAVALIGTLTAAWMEANDAQEDYWNTGIATSQAFKDALEATGDATVEINEGLGQIWQDGKLIFDQAAFDSRATAIASAIENAKDKVARSAEKFRDSVGLAFGTFGKDENSVFNVDVVIDKLKRMVDAAKGFGENLKKLTKQGAGADVINELIGMGPAQGNIVAKGLLESGRLSEYLGLRGSLFNTGAGAGNIANGASTANYTINVNKANMSADEIIRVIRSYEKKTGRRYFANG